MKQKNSISFCDPGFCFCVNLLEYAIMLQAMKPMTRLSLTEYNEVGIADEVRWHSAPLKRPYKLLIRGYFVRVFNLVFNS